MSTDFELVRSYLITGDEAVFRVLHARHSPALLRMARRAMGDESRAEDLVQEVWMRAFRGLGGFQGRSAFRTWLTGIALNRVRDLRRYQREHPGETPFDPQQVSRDASGASTIRPEEALCRRIDLQRRIAALSPGRRRIFLLGAVAGLSHKEIASRLSIEVATSKSQLSRARRQVAGKAERAA